MKKVYSLILILILSAPVFAQTTLTLQPHGAAGYFDYITDEPPIQAQPTCPEFDAWAWTNGGTPYLTRSLVKFDLQSIPVGATIQSATLTLYFNPTSSNGSGHSHLSGSNAAWLQRITSAWNNTTTTWNNQPTTTTQNEVALSQDTDAHQNYVLDVRNLVQDMVNNPSTSFGFLLKLQTEQYYRSLLFASCYNSDSSLHPKLVITYVTGCTSLVLQPHGAAGYFDYITNEPPIIAQPTCPEFDAWAWTNGGIPYLTRSMVKFDLASIPVGSTIQSAYLTLYFNPTSANGSGHSHLSGSNAAELQRITTSWTNTTTTWNNQPTTTTLHEAILPQDTDAHEDYRVDVRDLVQDMVNDPANSFGFLLKLQTEQYYRSLLFASCYNSDSTLHPKLEICYTVPTCTQLILQPHQDGGYFDYISDEYPTLAQPTCPEFDAWAWTNGGIPFVTRSMMKFDLNSIPSGSTVNSATMYLYYNPTNVNSGQSHLTGSDEAYLQRIISSWNNLSTTWNNQPSTTSVNEAYLPEDTAADESYIVDVTALVQDMVDNPSTSFGFMFRLVTEQIYRSLTFASCYYPDSTLHPKLEICYTQPEGMPEVDNNSLFLIYPNPSQGNIAISFQKVLQKGIIEIFNSLGQEIYSEKVLSSISRKEINLNAAAGIYFVKVSDGEKVFTKKLIIE